jgi:hypothetical protein
VGWGVGGWGLGDGPQAPIPNPQSPLIYSIVTTYYATS